jgi:hypothetical protein
MSVAIEQLAMSTKSPYMVTPRMIEGNVTDWQNLNTDSRPYVLYNPDPQVPGGSPQRVPPMQVWNEHASMGQAILGNMYSAVGVTEAALGHKSNEKSGKAIEARAKESETTTNVYSNNFMDAVTHEGRVIIDMISKVYDTERDVRLVNEDGKENFIKVNTQMFNENAELENVNDLSQGGYEIRAIAGQPYGTQQQEALQAVMEYIKIMPNSAPYFADVIAGFIQTPAKDELEARAKQYMQALLQPPQAMPPEMAGMQQMPAQNSMMIQQ